jgi:hypothetical protein
MEKIVVPGESKEQEKVWTNPVMATLCKEGPVIGVLVQFRAHRGVA